MKSRENSSRCTNCSAPNTTSPLCFKSLHVSNNTVTNLQTYSKSYRQSSGFKVLRKATFRVQPCGILLTSFNSSQSRKISIMQYGVLTNTIIKYDFRDIIILFVSDLWPKLEIDCFKATSSLLSANVIVTFHLQ